MKAAILILGLMALLESCKADCCTQVNIESTNQEVIALHGDLLGLYETKYASCRANNALGVPAYQQVEGNVRKNILIFFCLTRLIKELPLLLLGRGNKRHQRLLHGGSDPGL